MNKKILLTIMIGVFLISLVGATQQTLGTLKKGDDMNLIQTCGNCTFNNISTVLYPNSSIAISNVKMTKDDTFYNYTFNDTQTTGIYIVNGFGDPNGIKTSWAYDVEVTPTGTLLETSDSINYAILTLGSLFLFLLCLYGGMVLPFRNGRDGEGKIISVEKLKYFKVGLLFLSYVFFAWFLNLLLTLSTNFSVLTQFTKFFEVIFSVTNTVSLALFVLMLFVMSVLAWKDLQLKKLLEKGIFPD